MTTFLDTNILIYALDEGDDRHEWAKESMAKQREAGPLVICDIVYSELSVGLDSVEKTDEAIEKLALERIRFSKECLFRAGKAFKDYKKRGGPKHSMLSDFLIGAQAEVESAPLMTANFAEFKKNFPKVMLISP